MPSTPLHLSRFTLQRVNVDKSSDVYLTIQPTPNGTQPLLTANIIVLSLPLLISTFPSMVPLATAFQASALMPITIAVTAFSLNFFMATAMAGETVKYMSNVRPALPATASIAFAVLLPDAGASTVCGNAWCGSESPAAADQEPRGGHTPGISHEEGSALPGKADVNPWGLGAGDPGVGGCGHRPVQPCQLRVQPGLHGLHPHCRLCHVGNGQGETPSSASVDTSLDIHSPGRCPFPSLCSSGCEAEGHDTRLTDARLTRCAVQAAAVKARTRISDAFDKERRAIPDKMEVL
mmetsp:Transcript_27059/g.70197  ORF Transcript_27059/g.70197 Transcript_27059/m.70197 type:complete len:292 (+) Transcript_27059:957-1832(+)